MCEGSMCGVNRLRGNKVGSVERSKIGVMSECVEGKSFW